MDGRVIGVDAPPADRAMTRVAQRGEELGIVLHDPALRERPDLLRSVLSAAALPVELARLRVELRVQLAEVEASRERLVRAGDEERRRLERDLHDGAQQRLVGLGVALRRMQRSLPREAGVLSPALDQAVQEVGNAITDLRTIAAGLRPPRLDDGLAAALGDLARSSPLPGHGARGGRGPAAAARSRRLLHRVRGGHERRKARGRDAHRRRGDPQRGSPGRAGR